MEVKKLKNNYRGSKQLYIGIMEHIGILLLLISSVFTTYPQHTLLQKDNHIQSNFNGSNIFGTTENCSRHR